MTQEGADDAGGITKLSDLKGKTESMTLSGGPSARQRIDCKLGLEQVYGLKFKKFLSIDLAKRHEVIKNGQADVGAGVHDRRADQGREPRPARGRPQPVPALQRDAAGSPGGRRRCGPDFQEVVERVQEGLTTEVMQELNSRVDLDKEKPAAVAAAYLSEAGYVR